MEEIHVLAARHMITQYLYVFFLLEPQNDDSFTATLHYHQLL